MAGRKTSAAGGETQELVVCGSGGVGKSCLTIRFLKDQFSNEYDPTIEENYRKNIVVDQRPCTAMIIDTAGQQEYTSLRDQHLKDGKGFLLVFAVNDAKTFEEVKQLRDQIIKIKDTRKDLPASMHEVDMPAIKQYCQSAKIPLLETSAKEDIRVTEAFHDLVRECRAFTNSTAARTKAKKAKASKCLIL